jgi:hypothetical protein
VEAASYGAMLSSVLLAKLPPDLRLIVSRDVSSDAKLSMENLLKLFEKEFIARERASNHLHLIVKDEGVRREDDTPLHCQVLVRRELVLAFLVATASSSTLPRYVLR